MYCDTLRFGGAPSRLVLRRRLDNAHFWLRPFILIGISESNAENCLEATALLQLFAVCHMTLPMRTLRNTFNHFRSTLTFFNCVKL